MRAATRAIERAMTTQSATTTTARSATTTATTTLCVVTHEKLLNSRPLTERLRAETPRAFDVVVVSNEEEIDKMRRERADGDLAMLWWFATKEVTTAFASRRDVAERVKWMHSGSAGVDHLMAIPSVREHASTLTNGRGAFSASLGEWGVFACMHFAKRVDAMRAAQRRKEWIRMTVGLIEGKKLVIVGYGDIGQHVARRAKAMGMKVCAVRRTPEKTDPNDDYVENVVGFHALKETCAKADYVLVALPSTEETDKMINADVLSAMKDTAVLINVGRGSTVDEDALVDALRNKKIAGAALDVFAVEPLPSDHPFYHGKRAHEFSLRRLDVGLPRLGARLLHQARRAIRDERPVHERRRQAARILAHPIAASRAREPTIAS